MGHTNPPGGVTVVSRPAAVRVRGWTTLCEPASRGRPGNVRGVAERTGSRSSGIGLSVMSLTESGSPERACDRTGSPERVGDRALEKEN